jgi:asparagine synthase (glutamine-hydrolysing)
MWRYWQLPEMCADATCGDTDEVQLLEELETLLEDAVRRQLVADVPLGVLLSGGVDSSLVTVMAVRAAPKVKTFTVRFPGYDKYDETEHARLARLISRRFDTEHAEFDAAECTVDLLPLLARQFDEPIVDSSMIPTYLISRLVRGHCKVALGGDGGDELFAGYPQYNRLLWTQQRLGCIPRALRKPVARGAEILLPIGFKGRVWLQGLESDLERGLPQIASFFDRRSRRWLMAGQSSCMLTAEQIWEKRVPEATGLLQRATRMDFENYLAEDILVKLDRSSMLTSLEVRAPMLDYRLVEFAFSRVPTHLRATIEKRKILLKRLAAKLLPSTFDQDRKQGFSIPLAEWLKVGPWRDYFHSIILDQQCSFDKSAVTALIRGQDRGRNNQERLFGLVLFELWRREYKIAL